MSFSFNPNIPAVTDPILQSNFQIKANFQAIAQAFASNHFRLNGDPSTSGNHSYLTMRPQSGDPTTDATQVALYSKIASSIPQLFFMPNNAQTPIQLTYTSISVDDPEQMYSFIAGPFIVYGGRVDNVVNNQTITLSPGTTLLYVELTAVGISKQFYNTLPQFKALAQPIPINITGTSFDVYNEQFTGTLNIYYFAIGLP